MCRDVQRFITALLMVILGTTGGLAITPGLFEAQQTNSMKEKERPEVSPEIINNAKLRNYYFREFMELHYYNRTGMPRDGNFVENWIDLQIVYNTEMIAEMLSGLRTSYGVAYNLLERLEREPERPDIRSQSRRFFKEFREDVDDLRKKIDFMISGLPSKPKEGPINYSVEKGSSKSRMRMVEQELNEAEKLIGNYFFKPTHTVDVRDLNKNNMMIRLYRIEKILESLEKTIANP